MTNIDIDLKNLRRLLLTYQVAMGRYESTTEDGSKESEQIERAAEEAHQELYLALDPSTLESLIERAERWEESQRPRILVPGR